MVNLALDAASNSLLWRRNSRHQYQPRTSYANRIHVRRHFSCRSEFGSFGAYSSSCGAANGVNHRYVCSQTSSAIFLSSWSEEMSNQALKLLVDTIGLIRPFTLLVFCFFTGLEILNIVPRQKLSSGEWISMIFDVSPEREKGFSTRHRKKAL